MIYLILHIFTVVFAKTDSDILQELVFDYGHHPFISNVITCKGCENINLIKTLSTSFQRFVAVHDSDKTLIPSADDAQSFILDLECPQVLTVLQQANASNMFGKPFQWLLLGEGVACRCSDRNISEEAETWYWPFLESLDILTDSDVRVVEKDSNEKVTITGIYTVNSVTVREPLMQWTSKDGLVVLNSKSIPMRRWDLRGLALPSGYVVTDPESVANLDNLVDRNIDTTTKVSVNVIRLFGEMMNARLSTPNSLSYRVRNEWGVIVNGSYTGMIGDIQRREIELTASPIFLQETRMSFLEYYATFSASDVRFIFMSPPLSYSRNIFLMPFDHIVWMCCFIMITVCCSLLYAALSYENSRLTLAGRAPKETSAAASFSEILVMNIGAICLQGTAAQAKSPPGRIVTLFLYLSYMFLYISYSASIVAILQSSDTSIHTLEDFLRSPMKAGADDVIWSQYYMKNANGSLRKAIYNKKIAPKGERPHFLPVEEGIKAVQKGFYGFHVELTAGYYQIQKTFTEEEKCGLQHLDTTFFTFNSQPWVVMKKRSSYSEHFKIAAKFCIERGISKRFGQRYYAKEPRCSSKSSRYSSVGLIDCYYAFFLLAYGLLTSSLILLLEIGLSKYVKIVKKRKRLKEENPPPEFEFFN